MGEIDKKHINEFIKGQMTEYIYIALSDLVLYKVFFKKACSRIPETKNNLRLFFWKK